VKTESLMDGSNKSKPPKQLWLWAGLGLLFMITSVCTGIVAFLVIKKHVIGSKLSSGSAITAIDLRPYYDQTEAWDRPGEWEAPPHGHHVLGGVPFEANGLLRLIGNGAQKDKRTYREKVEGIVVGRKFERLYLLHAASYPARDETPYASVVLHYADGSTWFDLLYGRHARDWWRPKNEAVSAVSDPDSKVVWRGDGNFKPNWTRRLYKTTFANPRPHEKVATVDVVSQHARPNAVIIAMSVGPATLPAPEDDPPSLPEP